MNRPKIIQAQCPSCNHQTDMAICRKSRKRGHKTEMGIWFRNLDCNQWAPVESREVVPDLCPTCGRPVEAAHEANKG